MSRRGEAETLTRSDWGRKAAWILVIISIVFWLWFGIGSALVEAGGWLNWMMHMLIPGGFFIFSALIAWRWQLAGGILFVVEGVVASGLLAVALLGGSLRPSVLLLMLLTLAFPPLVAGVLFLVYSERELLSRSAGGGR